MYISSHSLSRFILFGYILFLKCMPGSALSWYWAQLNFICMLTPPRNLPNKFIKNIMNRSLMTEKNHNLVTQKSISLPLTLLWIPDIEKKMSFLVHYRTALTLEFLIEYMPRLSSWHSFAPHPWKEVSQSTVLPSICTASAEATRSQEWYVVDRDYLLPWGFVSTNLTCKFGERTSHCLECGLIPSGCSDLSIVRRP